MFARLDLYSVAPKLMASVVSLALAWMPVPTWACTSVYFGSETTASGEVIYGRTEAVGSRYPKQFGVELMSLGKTYWSGQNGNQQDPAINFTRESPGNTYRYTYVRDLPLVWNGAEKPYSEAGVNTEGVSVDATVTTNCNEAILGLDPLVSTGLGEYCIADIVLSEASSARAGVELLGTIVDEQGSHECNHIWLADTDECWVFQQLSGHQWIALRAPDDVISINSNLSSLQFSVDLSDADSCLHSAGLETIAQDAGTAVYDETGRFNVAQSYGLEYEDPQYLTRYVQGLLFLGAELTPEDNYSLLPIGTVSSVSERQLFVAPPRQGYELLDAMHLLSSRGEDTPLDANFNTTLPTISSPTVAEAHLFQIREDMAPELATIEWLALSRSEFGLYIPSYAALLTEVDEDLYPTEEGFDPAHSFGSTTSQEELQQALEGTESTALNYVFMDLDTLASFYRVQVGEGVHAYLDALQLELIDQQEQLDQLMSELPDDVDPKVVANKAHEFMSQQSYGRASKLLDELKAYVTGATFLSPLSQRAWIARGICPNRYASWKRCEQARGIRWGCWMMTGLNQLPPSCWASFTSLVLSCCRRLRLSCTRFVVS